jgi:hypothetical protein
MKPGFANNMARMKIPCLKISHRSRFSLFITVFIGVQYIQYAMLFPACHRIPHPWDSDPVLPAAFRTPHQTFLTWQQASLKADRQALKACYWSGLERPELESWLTENLRPEASHLFRDAHWQGMKPKTPVEVTFHFTTGQGQEFYGVMVRTKDGWKIQHW